MDITKVISAMDSELKRETLKVLAERPNNVSGVMQRLKTKGFNVKYRETIYRALEKLVESGLVEKYYEHEKGLCYKLSLTRLTIVINRESLNVEY
jgi:DNA-binding PadR family transcriptional regulator